MVHEVPDFAAVCRDGPLSPRAAARIWVAAASIRDHLDADFAGEVVWLVPLPRVVEPFVDDEFTAKFRERMAVVTNRLATGEVGPRASAACRADEMGLHLAIEYAQLRDVDDWILGLPEEPVLDEDLDHASDVLLEDDDIVLLYDPELTVEALDGYVAMLDASSDAPYLHPRDWFTPFAAG